MAVPTGTAGTWNASLVTAMRHVSSVCIPSKNRGMFGSLHPAGSELIVVTEGELTLVQEIEGESVKTALGAGEYAINAAGVWHTADVSEPTTAIFITAGAGTGHRQR